MVKKIKKKGRYLDSNPSITFKNWLIKKGSLSTEELIGLINEIRCTSRNLIVANYIVMELFQVPIFKSAFDNLLKNRDFEVDLFNLNTLIESSIDDSLHFVSTLITHYSKECSFFVQERKVLEKALLDENYNVVECQLDKIIENCGQSIWTVSTYFSSLFFQQKDKELLDFRNSLPEELSRKSSGTIIYEFLKSRSTATHESYIQSLGRQLEDLRVHGYENLEDYFRFISNFNPTDSYADLRVIISNCSVKRIPDLYTYFIRIFRYCLLHGIELEKTFKMISEVQDQINDDELTLLLNKYQSSYDGNIGQEKYLKEISNQYISGDLVRVIKSCDTLFKEHPNLSFLYEIVSKSITSNDDLQSYPPMVKKIITRFYQLNNKNDIDTSLKELKLIFLNLKQFDWAYHIRAQFEKYAFKSRESISTCYSFADSTQVRISPFDLKFLSSIKSKTVREILCSYWEGNIFIQEFLGSSTQDTIDFSNNIPSWRSIKGKAEFLFLSGEYNESLALFNKLEHISEPQLCQQEIRARVVDCYYKNEDYKYAIKEMSICLLHGIEPALLPLKTISKYIISHIKRNKDIELLEACAISLHYFNLKYPTTNVTQEISNIVENLLFEIGINNHSELNPLSWPLSHFLLSKVMTVDVMDGLITFFHSDADIYKTRLDICSTYIKENPKHDFIKDISFITNEYNSVFNRLILFICSSDINEGRIKIEKEALKVLLIEEYAEGLEQLDRNVAIEDVKFVEIKNNDKFDVTVTGSDTVNTLAELLLSIYREYTVNKLHGLDNCLNLRFRHGEVRNHLWSPLRKQGLAGRKAANNKFSVDEVFEDYRLFNEESLSHAKTSLSNFLVEIEKDIYSFRGKCNADSVDLVGEDERFFQYILAPQNIIDFVELFSVGKSFESLVDSVFVWLDDQTESILTELRTVALNELKEKMLLKFDKLLTEVEFAPLAFKQKVSLARSEIAERIDDMSAWFEWAEEPSSPFNFGAVYEKSSELVESLYPSIRINKVFKDDTHILIKPANFTTLVTVLSLAIENSTRHCGLSIELDLSVSIKKCGSSYILEVRNSISKEVFKTLSSRIDVMNDELSSNNSDKASKDTGSGLFKIKSLLANRVKVKANISVALKQDEYKLIIQIIDGEGLLYENSDS